MSVNCGNDALIDLQNEWFLRDEQEDALALQEFHGRINKDADKLLIDIGYTMRKADELREDIEGFGHSADVRA